LGNPEIGALTRDRKIFFGLIAIFADARDERGPQATKSAPNMNVC
jgi:hypothetical protein